MQVLCHTYSYYLRFVARPFSFSSSCPTNQSISPIRCVWMRGQAEPLRLSPEGVWGSTDLGMLKFFVLLDLPPGMEFPTSQSPTPNAFCGFQVILNCHLLRLT